MAFLICYIPIAIIALVVHFFSADAAGWFVWALSLVTSTYFLIKSFARSVVFGEGETLSGNEITLLAYSPFSASGIIAIALALLLTDFSKLHLLWVAPLLGLLFEFTVGARTARKLEEWPERRH